MTRMAPSARTAALARRFALGALVLASLACQPKVGDPCKRGIDCGLNVVRQCDVSNVARDPEREGECIVENCSFGVCPKEAVCIKVYPSEFLSVACDPEAEDMGVRDNCLPTEVCLPEGLCADEVRARTSCRRECNSDRNCRDNYKCVETGSNGLYVAPDPENPIVQQSAKICVPR